MTGKDKDKVFKYWQDEVLRLQSLGYQLPSKGIRIQIPNARVRLQTCYEYLLSVVDEEFKWTPELDEIAEWLTDNHYKGLLLHGNLGCGKTFFVRYVLPLLLQGTGKIASYFDVTQAIKDTDAVLKQSVIILDDVGTEQRRVDYGTERDTVNEVIDAAEKYGKMLIITTNLTKDEIKVKYGDRTLDRLLKLTKRINYKGKSFRS